MTRSFKVAGLLAFTSVTRGNAGVILLTVLILYWYRSTCYSYPGC